MTEGITPGPRSQVPAPADDRLDAVEQSALRQIWVWTWEATSDQLRVRRVGEREAEFVRDWRERLATEDRERVIARLEGMVGALAENRVLAMEVRARDGRGVWRRWWLRGKSSARDPQNLEGTLVLLGTLEASEPGLDAALDQTPAVFFVKDRRGRYIYANRRLLDLFRGERRDVIGKTAFDLFPSSIAEALERNDARVWQGQTLYVEETVVENGRNRTFLCVKFPLRSPEAEDRIMRLCCVAIDISDRKRAELALNRELAELGRSNDELLQFAVSASHDLKEPLRLMATSLRQVELLGTPPESKSWIARALNSADQMGLLIDELLIYARAGANTHRFAAVDCGRIVQNVLAILRLPIEESRALIRIGEMPTVWGDEVLLGQLFQNLISNAVKFRRGEPDIRISAVRSGAYWRFTVRDNGIGIDPRYFREVFEPFRRLHTRHEYPGSGIGLAICRKVVERHGGEIGVDSEPGRGAVFEFSLPAVS